MMIVVAYLSSFLCLILNGLLFLRLKPPYSFYLLWFPQLVAHALSPFLVVVGGLGAGLGWLYHAPLAVAAGPLGAGISIFYIWRVTAPQPGFEHAFGRDWQGKIPPFRESHLLQTRWTLGLPRTAEPRWERDIPFWTIPGTGRKLLCDLWQPPDGVAQTGLAFVYLHGGAWYLLDKDSGTRPFFQQLAAQGHVIMDVAYRLCPEVDIYEMVGDVKRAVAWMKANADRYGVDPERIVLGGGSAGGHLALLAAYAPDQPPAYPRGCTGSRSFGAGGRLLLRPDRFAGGLRAHRPNAGDRPAQARNRAAWCRRDEKNMQDAGRLDLLLGGHLHKVPAVYALASPVTHVHPGCPPTLLIEGELDLITPVSAYYALHRRLVECGVPAIDIVYPLTQHAFDLLLPQVSPPAQAALYEVERFLALIAARRCQEREYAALPAEAIAF